MATAVLIGVIVFTFINFVFVLLFSFTLWMAVDAAKGDKFWWIVLILGLPLVGPTVYFFVEKKQDYLKITTEQKS